MVGKNLLDNFYDWWKNIDKIILLLIFLLFFLGLFFSLVSTSIIASDKLNTNSYYFFVKHLIFVFVGIISLIFISFLKEEDLINFSLLFFVIFFILLLLVPILGIEVKGSRRWLKLGLLPRFQPIELLKPFIIVSLSILLTNQKIHNYYFKILSSLILIFPIILLLIIQPDIGQTILIILIWSSFIFVSGVNLIIFFSFFSFNGILFCYFVFFVPKFEYIKIRILSFISSESKNSNQSDKAIEAIIDGGLFGKGIGEGTLNTRIPEAHTDFIISVISEEFGSIIIILIMLLFLYLAFKILKKIDAEISQKNKLILLGCTILILLQSFVHIGVNIKILPTTGMTLPFLSYGGSSIISTSIISGIILNLTKRKIKII